MQRPFASLAPPLVFAHRGASWHAPENTLEAFELAARLGAQVLELDVQLTADKAVVVSHDATVDRMTDGHGAIAGMPLEALRRLDAATGFRTPSGANPFEGRGVRVPLLAEVLAGFGHRGINVDLKGRDPQLLAAVLQTVQRSGHPEVLLTSGDDAMMGMLEAAKPRQALGLSRGQAKRVLGAAHFGQSLSGWAGRALQVPPTLYGVPLLPQRVVRRLHAAGLSVHAWVVNDVGHAQRLIRAGVDGIMTDDPGTMVAALGCAPLGRSI